LAFDSIAPTICENRLRELSERVPERNVKSIWPGARNPAKTAYSVTGLHLKGVPATNQNRDELLASIPSLSEEAAFFAIMAWGGQQKPHTVSSWSERDKWLNTLENLRKGQISPVEAYDHFFRANVSGLGPAFYTKLIFFLQHDKFREGERGFIMDQWTAKSMELLHKSQQQGLRLKWMSVQYKTPHGIPSYSAALARQNSAEIYRYFCNFVHELQRQLHHRHSVQLTTDQVEETIFAGAPKRQRPLPWREFTMRNWVP